MIAALLMLAQIAPAQAEPKPVSTTIAAVRANPKKFDRQVVRLSGYVNSCVPAACSIDERVRTSAGAAGQALSIAPDQKFDDTIKPLLPTYVELDARVDAACLSSNDCTGRAPVLQIVSLRSVVSPEPPPIEN
jgi:hypothetical protein